MNERDALDSIGIQPQSLLNEPVVMRWQKVTRICRLAIPLLPTLAIGMSPFIQSATGRALLYKRAAWLEVLSLLGYGLGRRCQARKSYSPKNDSEISKQLIGFMRTWNDRVPIEFKFDKVFKDRVGLYLQLDQLELAYALHSMRLSKKQPLRRFQAQRFITKHSRGIYKLFQIDLKERDEGWQALHRLLLPILQKGFVKGVKVEDLEWFSETDWDGWYPYIRLCGLGKIEIISSINESFKGIPESQKPKVKLLIKRLVKERPDFTHSCDLLDTLDEIIWWADQPFQEEVNKLAHKEYIDKTWRRVFNAEISFEHFQESCRSSFVQEWPREKLREAAFKIEGLLSQNDNQVNLDEGEFVNFIEGFITIGVEKFSHVYSEDEKKHILYLINVNKKMERILEKDVHQLLGALKAHRGLQRLAALWLYDLLCKSQQTNFSMKNELMGEFLGAGEGKGIEGGGI